MRWDEREDPGPKTLVAFDSCDVFLTIRFHFDITICTKEQDRLSCQRLSAKLLLIHPSV